MPAPMTATSQDSCRDSRWIPLISQRGEILLLFIMPMLERGHDMDQAEFSHFGHERKQELPSRAIPAM
jgi:hypothetical protein